MDLMRYLLAGLGLAVMTVGQSPPVGQKPQAQPAVGASAKAPSKIAPVRFGSNGWPVIAGDRAPAPAAETRNPRGPKRSRHEQPDIAAHDVLVAQATSERPLASGMQLDSPMHEIFRSTRSPGALRELGGVIVWWRLTVHGTHGEDIGIREITHTADCVYATRDRLVHEEQGNVFVRIGDNVSAQHHGTPWESLTEDARAQLALFGMHLRLPWCFGDGKAYVIVRREVAVRREEKLVKLILQRRPPANEQVFGPELNRKARDEFELLYEPTTGQPRELVHRYASSGQKRRVLLEDWRDVGGVRMPHRRIYVDEAGRPTTTLEIVRLLPKVRVSDRDFRLY